MIDCIILWQEEKDEKNNITQALKDMCLLLSIPFILCSSERGVKELTSKYAFSIVLNTTTQLLSKYFFDNSVVISGFYTSLVQLIPLYQILSLEEQNQIFLHQSTKNEICNFSFTLPIPPTIIKNKYKIIGNSTATILKKECRNFIHKTWPYLQETNSDVATDYDFIIWLNSEIKENPPLCTPIIAYSSCLCFSQKEWVKDKDGIHIAKSEWAPLEFFEAVTKIISPEWKHQFYQHQLKQCGVRLKQITPPLVSVIIPTYNRYKSCKIAIDSVIAQTYPKKCIQIIVVNDRSTQKEYYTDDWLNINIIHLEQNTRDKFGFACAGFVRNQGMKFSNGEWIAFLDDDDIWLPNKLHDQISAIQSQNESQGKNDKNENKILICSTEAWCGFDTIDSWENKYENKFIKFNTEKYWEYTRFSHKLNHPSDIPKIWNKQFLKENNNIICSSVVFHKELFIELGGMKEIPNSQEDFDYWTRFMKYTNLLYLSKPCIYYNLSHSEKKITQ